MSIDYAHPSSSPLERDARLVNADDEHVSAADIALGVVIGRTSEFFDFFVYGIASVLVFPQVVFPTYDRLTGTLFSFAIFALAFLARPLGSVIFMEIDRQWGRGTKLTIALFLLGGSTAAIAFLPSYNQVGYLSAVLLAAFRICQGIALGGAWDGLASLLALNAPQSRRGWYASVVQLGAPLGLMIASGLFLFFASTTSQADFLDWGWRFPFYVAFVINVVALFARLRLVSTREFANLIERKELEPTRVAEMFDEEGGHVIIGAFAPLASFAMFHLVTVFPLSWIFLYSRQPIGDFLWLEIVGGVVGLCTVAISGVVADRIGRRRTLAYAAGLIAAFAFAAPFLLGAGGIAEVAFMILGFALLGFSFGQASGAVASTFPLKYRYTGSALTSDLAWLIGAGFAPLVALSLCSQFGLVFVGAYLLSGAICTLAALKINKQFELQD